ncbi:MAG: aspartate--tRNA ligase [Opitutales bacterium]
MKRTHHCAQLRKEDAGQDAVLVGWIQSIRDHGGVLFVDLRDREGLTQIVFDHDNAELQAQAAKLRDESVVQISGKVRPRHEGTENANLPTGAIEVSAREVVIHNLCEVLPFPLEEEKADRVNEDLRMQFRYLDLRRRRNFESLRRRHRAAQSVRRYFDEQGFLEIETPILFKSTPEGAREFLVPSRHNPGDFFALSQSPQQYKQMLMVSGVERYYSLAKCFRDEDQRADRQPEFTQIDLELSFIDREDMYSLIEGLLRRVWKEVLDTDIPTPFDRMPYREAMDRYGVDKPDRRFAMLMEDFSEDFKQSQFKVFAATVQGGGVVKAFNAKGLADLTQGELKTLEDTAKTLGAKGLAFIRAQDGEWKSPILKFFSEAEKEALRTRLNVEDGDMVFFAAAQWERACTILGRVRLDSARLLEKRGKLTIRPDDWQFLWVVDFPLMIYEEDEGRYVAAHHPFTSPVEEDIPLLDTDPKAVRGQHYDVVLNGMELGGGSIRIHQPDLQQKVFEDVLKIPPDIVESRFGYMLRAFQFGAPPHGGIALGFDRLCTLLSGRTNIRDVIAFPKNQKAQDAMVASPGPVTERQLRDCFITTTDLPEG